MPSFWHGFSLFLCLRARCNLVWQFCYTTINQHHNAKVSNVLGPNTQFHALLWHCYLHHESGDARFLLHVRVVTMKYVEMTKPKTTRSPAKSRVVKKLDQNLRKWTMLASFKDLDRWTSARQQALNPPSWGTNQTKMCETTIFLSAPN